MWIAADVAMVEHDGAQRRSMGVHHTIAAAERFLC
jgi:hypothetical protein